MAILMFNAFYNLLPINIQKIFQIYINIRPSRRKKHVFHKLLLHNFKETICIKCRNNALPDDITNISSIHFIERHIKSSYLHNY